MRTTYKWFRKKKLCYIPIIIFTRMRERKEIKKRKRRDKEEKEKINILLKLIKC